MNQESLEKAQKKLAFLESDHTNLVLQWLVEAEEPLTPTTMYMNIRSRMLAKSDIFRTLSGLHKIGLAKKMRLGSNSYYSPNLARIERLGRTVRKFEYDESRRCQD